MPPEITKLIAAITQLVSTLNESAGIPSTEGNSGGDPRYDKNKERVSAAPGLLVRMAEVQDSDKAWNKISKIFARNFKEISAKPDYGEEEEEKENVPTIISQVATTQEKAQEGFFAKLMKLLLPLAILVGGIAASIGALFAGPGELGNTLGIVGELMIERGRRFLVSMGERLIGLGDEFIKGISGIGETVVKLFGVGEAGTLGKMLGEVAAKAGGVLLKVARFLPFIGSAVSFYFAYQRFKEGDYVGMSLEIASGLLNLIPGFGWIASSIVDVAILAREFTTTKEERAAGGMGIVGKLFSGIGDWFKKHGMTILKSLPTIGSLIYFWEAYQAGFTTSEGIKKTLTAFASVMGLGPVIEPAINTLFSILGEKGEGDKPMRIAPVKSFFNIVKDFVVSRISKLPLWLRTPLEWLGLAKSSDGEDSGPSIIDNISSIAGVAGEAVKNWFVDGYDKAKEMTPGIIEKMSSFGGTVKGWFVDGYDKAKEMTPGIIEKMSSFGGTVKGWFVDGYDKAKEMAPGIIEKMKATASSIAENMKAARENIKKSIEAIKDIISPILDEIGDGALEIIDWVAGIFGWVRDKITGFISTVIPSFLVPARNKNKEEAPSSIVIHQDSVFKIENAALDAIAVNSRIQINILKAIAEKLEIPGPSETAAAAPSPSASPTLPSGSGSITSGFSSNTLFDMNLAGTVA